MKHKALLNPHRWAAVLAEWSEGCWYAGKITTITKKSFRIKFLDGGQKIYGCRSSKVLPVKSALPFDTDNCGPYGIKHARYLASLKSPPATKNARWVVSEYRANGGKWEWHVGKVVKVKRSKRADAPGSCIVAFNNDEVLERFRPEGVLYVNHPAPFVLSGPYQERDIHHFTGDYPKSPLGLPSKASAAAPKEKYPSADSFAGRTKDNRSGARVF
jgi:hypothetical protein